MIFIEIRSYLLVILIEADCNRGLMKYFILYKENLTSKPHLKLSKERIPVNLSTKPNVLKKIGTYNLFFTTNFI